MSEKFVVINTQQEVEYVHFLPFDKKDGLSKTREELLQIGYLTEKEYPNPEPLANKYYKTYYNPVTNEFRYLYFDAEKTPEQIKDEKITALEQQVADLNVAMAALMGGAV